MRHFLQMMQITRLTTPRLTHSNCTEWCYNLSLRPLFVKNISRSHKIRCQLGQNRNCLLNFQGLFVENASFVTLIFEKIFELKSCMISCWTKICGEESGRHIIVNRNRWEVRNETKLVLITKKGRGPPLIHLWIFEGGAPAYSPRQKKGGPPLKNLKPFYCLKTLSTKYKIKKHYGGYEMVPFSRSSDYESRKIAYTRILFRSEIVNWYRRCKEMLITKYR